MANTAGPIDLSVGVLVVRQADDEARAHGLDEGAEHLARELGVVVHHQHVSAASGAFAGMHLALQQVDVVLDHVESNPPLSAAFDPVHPNHPAPQ